MRAALAFLILAFAASPGRAGGWRFWPFCECDDLVHVAHEIDCLEKRIDAVGSVGVKHPDVWGQARLMKHRREYESILAPWRHKFEVEFQASATRSDQAMFADATALGAAAMGKGADGLIAPATSPTINVNSAQSLVGAQSTQSAPQTAGVPQNGQAAPGQAVNNSLIYSSAPFAPTGGMPRFDSGSKLALEPTEKLDQHSRYLQHLNQLRRNNEGDDTADSPGYAIYLLRMPVSLLPGAQTRKGYGAEVSLGIAPYLSDELLTTTFRTLVINDLVQQISGPLAVLLNDAEIRDDLLRRWAESEYAFDGVKTEGELRAVGHVADSAAVSIPIPTAGSAPPDSRAGPRNLRGMLDKMETGAQALPRAVGAESAPQRLLVDQLRNLLNELQSVHGSRSRLARLPFPPSQMIDIFGPDPVLRVLRATHQAFGHLKYIHRHDLSSYLREELYAAYEFLRLPAHQPLWALIEADSESSMTLGAAIRGRCVAEIERRRAKFFQFCHCRIAPSHPGKPAQETITAAFGWAVLVECALLSDRLAEDIQETLVAKGCARCENLPRELYLPDPCPEARRAFQDYVRCRWPVHVFSLDPAVAEQNVADRYSRRRETQLALAMSLAAREINFQKYSRYVRRLEWDMDAVALNRTAVGFAHGATHFGWRFAPRVQTPDVESHVKTVFRDLFWGGPTRDDDLRQREMEPGMRECHAVVIMPSFVPYAKIHVRGSWQKLVDPRVTVMNLDESVAVGRKLQELAFKVVASPDCRDRPGDAERLLARLKQLEARLPVQDMLVQVPYENTLGGFALFNNGTTDLGPDLHNWYGEPGIRLDRPTAMFLGGDHFSVHETRVIAGGREIPEADVELLSRQVMKVTFPPGLVPDVHPGEEPIIDVHVATPYGVSRHLHVPIAPQSAEPGATWTRGTDRLVAAHRFQANAEGKSSLLIRSIDDAEFQLSLAPGAAELIGDETAVVVLKLAFVDPRFVGVAMPDIEITGVPLRRDRNGYLVKLPGKELRTALAGFAAFVDKERINPLPAMVTLQGSGALRIRAGAPAVKVNGAVSLSLLFVPAQ